MIFSPLMIFISWKKNFYPMLRIISGVLSRCAEISSSNLQQLKRCENHPLKANEIATCDILSEIFCQLRRKVLSFVTSDKKHNYLQCSKSWSIEQHSQHHSCNLTQARPGLFFSSYREIFIREHCPCGLKDR